MNQVCGECRHFDIERTTPALRAAGFGTCAFTAKAYAQTPRTACVFTPPRFAARTIVGKSEEKTP